jgi:hypothetical protein
MRALTMRQAFGRRIPVAITATVERFAGMAAALLNIRQRGQEDAYLLVELPATDGRGFQLRKPDGSSYEVLIHSREMNLDTCSCPGGIYAGRCKHADALRGLVDAGELPQNHERKTTYPSLTAEEI